MTEHTKIELIVDPPTDHPVPQLRMTRDELRRRSRRRTLVQPVGPRLFQIYEPSLVNGFSYGDVIEATPLGNNAWRFIRVFTKSPKRQLFLSPELLCSILYLEARPTYRLIRTIYDEFRHPGCAIRQFEDWIVLGYPPDLPFDPLARIKPPESATAR
jgi:hypothetical protein